MCPRTAAGFQFSKNPAGGPNINPAEIQVFGVAGAVYHHHGVRLRNWPLLLDKRAALRDLTIRDSTLAVNEATSREFRARRRASGHGTAAGEEECEPRLKEKYTASPLGGGCPPPLIEGVNLGTGAPPRLCDAHN